MLLVTVLSVGFAACGSDDDDDSGSGAVSISESALIGSWEGPIRVFGVVYERDQKIEVNQTFDESQFQNRLVIEAGHTYTVYKKNKNGGWDLYERGNWSLKDNWLTVNYVEKEKEAQRTITTLIKEVTSDTFTMKGVTEESDGSDANDEVYATYRRMK